MRTSFLKSVYSLSGTLKVYFPIECTFQLTLWKDPIARARMQCLVSLLVL